MSTKVIYIAKQKGRVRKPTTAVSFVRIFGDQYQETWQEMEEELIFTDYFYVS
jgi:hypothetical protein